MKILFILSCLISFILSSCISFERNIKLNNDGSGSEFLIVHLDKKFFETLNSGDTTTVNEFSKAKGPLPKKSFTEFYLYSLFLTELYNMISGDKRNNILNYKEKYFTDSSKDLEIEYEFKDISKLKDIYLWMFKIIGKKVFQLT